MSTAGAVPVKPEELEALRLRLETRQLHEEDFPLLMKLISTVQTLVRVLEHKRASIARLKKMLFGSPTEKSKTEVASTLSVGQPRNRAAKGHGRHSAQSYFGAKRVEVPHPQLKAGERCPECGKGNLYCMNKPSSVVWLEGKAPVQAVVYECQRMRCSGCGKLFTAEAPQEARQKKYDESVGSMVALLRYGNGLPFFRLQQLQRSMGVPLPASVQWQLAQQKAQSLKPIHEALLRHAAQGQLMRVDDTTMTILERDGRDTGWPECARQKKDNPEKKGTRTTAIVSSGQEDRQVVLYATGARQAGQNMDRLLSQREAQRPAPIQMCDALASNLPKQFHVILANCLAHARRKFLEITEPFPREVELVLYAFQYIYANEEEATRANLSPQQRLELHQLRSAFVMEGLFAWMHAQINNTMVEPNSQLGQAFSYMFRHREPLTVFLRVPDAPLDNNLCEIILKRAILHRKNSLFYKTSAGAEVGDLLMSIISTCTMNGVNPLLYLTDVEKHAAEVAQNVESWLPWNYVPQPSPTAQPP